MCAVCVCVNTCVLCVSEHVCAVCVSVWTRVCPCEHVCAVCVQKPEQVSRSVTQQLSPGAGGQAVPLTLLLALMG